MVSIGLVLVVCLQGCDSAPSSDEPPELICDEPTGIERALPPDFTGYESPENAARAWSETVDLPDGTWEGSNAGYMVLVDDDGNPVARATVTEMMESSATTFDTTRYVSSSIDFCD